VTAPASYSPRLVSVNLLGVVEHPALGESPYRIDIDGAPYVPAGDGGIVLGLRLGDSAFALSADHAAPGACLVHPDPAARHALTTFACVGNRAEVRTGRAAGAIGAVLGKRGEEGRVIVGFSQDDLAMMRPSDQVSVRGCGQGLQPAGFPAQVMVLNLDPGLLSALPIIASGSDAPGKLTATPGTAAAPDAEGTVEVRVRAIVPGKLAGNGLGRPAAGWDLDLQLPPPGPDGAGDVLLGDLVAVTDIDARYNMGYRRGWVTIGIVGHGSSPLPGHGPGLTPILTAPARALTVREDGERHVGLTERSLRLTVTGEPRGTTEGGGEPFSSMSLSRKR
jgi:Domain of unknown function (DUF4438)